MWPKWHFGRSDMEGVVRDDVCHVGIVWPFVRMAGLSVRIDRPVPPSNVEVETLWWPECHFGRSETVVVNVDIDIVDIIDSAPLALLSCQKALLIR